MKISPCNHLYSKKDIQYEKLDSDIAIRKVYMSFSKLHKLCLLEVTIVCHLHLCPGVFGNPASIMGNYFIEQCMMYKYPLFKPVMINAKHQQVICCTCCCVVCHIMLSLPWFFLVLYGLYQINLA